MGLIDLNRDNENFIAKHYSDARGPVIRGKHTELAVVNFAQGEGARMHSHNEEQFVLVLEGCIRFETEDDVKEVRAGQVYFIPSQTPHATRALEESRAISFKNLVDPSYDATASAEDV